MSLIERTNPQGMRGMTNGMVQMIIPGKNTRARMQALRGINQQTLCNTCRGRCSCNQAMGPVGKVIIRG